MSIESFSASIERTKPQEIQIYRKKIHHEFVSNFLDMVPLESMIVDWNRQIVHINQVLEKKLSAEELESIFGKRPGEFLGCIRAQSSEYGCGTAHSCRFCGAVQAVLECQRTSQKASRDAHIMVRESGFESQLDFRVTAVPFLYDENQFTILFFEDISAEVHYNLLQRIFFHDLINSSGALISIAHGIKEEAQGDLDLIDLLCCAADSLYDEILSQKLLFLAESKQLTVCPKKVRVSEILKNAADMTQKRFVDDGRKIILKDNGEIFCTTDPVILKRILINLMKNALEATTVQSPQVEVWYGSNENGVFFCVKNDTVMTDTVKEQLFYKTFSTKGDGRGVGTYSIKLLTEHYLGGKATYESDEKNGTIFTITLPSFL